MRPFTAKWHGQVSAGALSDADRSAFRQELSRLQEDLRNYTRLLADLAAVEDLTDLEVTVQTPRRIRPGLMGFVPQPILQPIVFG